MEKIYFFKPKFAAANWEYLIGTLSAEAAPMPPVFRIKRQTRSLRCGRDDVKRRESTKVDFKANAVHPWPVTFVTGHS